MNPIIKVDLEWYITARYMLPASWHREHGHGVRR